jgi:hypothetical protein
VNDVIALRSDGQDHATGVDMFGQVLMLTKSNYSVWAVKIKALML